MIIRQHVKIFDSRSGKSAIEQLEQFVSQETINAISISLTEKAVLLLYEDV